MFFKKIIQKIKHFDKLKNKKIIFGRFLFLRTINNRRVNKNRLCLKTCGKEKNTKRNMKKKFEKLNRKVPKEKKRF